MEAATIGVIMRATARLGHQHGAATVAAEKFLKNWLECAGIRPTGGNTAIDRQAGGNDREADLVGRASIEPGRRFAHAHVPDDILDLDDRIVDQHPRDQAQREQRHLVQREAEQVMNQNVGIADNGIASAEMKVARQSRRTGTPR